MDKTVEILARHDALREKYPDSIILFRSDAGYTTYGLDARVVSKICGTCLFDFSWNGLYKISITQFPGNMLSDVVEKLVRSGKRIVIDDNEY